MKTDQGWAVNVKQLHFNVGVEAQGLYQANLVILLFPEIGKVRSMK